tara:strand:- start:353 stop:721 length:369 start_codon:yes stop_codon:yes gene_type:complete
MAKKTEEKSVKKAADKAASLLVKKVPVGKPFVKNDPRINRAGRRIGSRNKFSQAFTDAMLLDFEQYGDSVIAEVRQKDPSTYVRIATALIPSKTEQEIEVKDSSAETVSEIDWDIIIGGNKG